MPFRAQVPVASGSGTPRGELELSNPVVTLVRLMFCMTSFNCLQLVCKPSILSALARKSRRGCRKVVGGGPKEEEEERERKEPDEEEGVMWREEEREGPMLREEPSLREEPEGVMFREEERAEAREGPRLREEPREREGTEEEVVYEVEVEGSASKS